MSGATQEPSPIDFCLVESAPCREPPLTSAYTQYSRRSFSVTRYNGCNDKVPRISLLLTTYEKSWSLKHVLTSIAMQRNVADSIELVVADDGSEDDTHSVVTQFAKSVDFPVAVTSHEHETFQVARCRNEGILTSRAPYLLFLDGDCILPPDHIAIHLRRRQSHTAMCGYCVRLDEDLTHRFTTDTIRRNEYLRWITPRHQREMKWRHRKAKTYQLLHHPTKPRLAGGNFGIWRSDMERVNGFDENFEGWGGEDTDLGLRLRTSGVRLMSILKWTHTYHLWHPPNTTTPSRIREGLNHSYHHRGFRLTRCMKGLHFRDLSQIQVRLVGRPDSPSHATAFLKSIGLCLDREACSINGAPEVEVLVLPGKGNFTSASECRVLIMLGDQMPSSQSVRRAHVIIGGCSRLAKHATWFPLEEAAQAMAYVGGQRFPVDASA